LEFHQLSVSNVTQETTLAYSYEFEIPASLKEAFAYKAGQYLTLELEIDGKKVRRAYSMSSSPKQNSWKVTIKRVEGGLFSNFFIDHIKEGDWVQVAPPEGRFTLDFAPDRRRTHYFVCAGSGITPIISLIKASLEEEPLSPLYLLYGNKSENSVIFREELQLLENKYKGQLFVEHCYSAEKKGGGLMNLFKKKDFEGRINAETLRKFLLKYPSETEEKHYFLCGPGEMIQACKNYLGKTGIQERYLHEEYFSAGGEKPMVPLQEGESQVEVRLHGEDISFSMNNSQTILEKLEELGYDPPYSCMSGSCSTCMAKCLSGSVTMDSSLALNKVEIENGLILTCQARPQSEKITISYDDL
jgi:ring-1,2-phenylacetyl-CoA epoxidase subunit PaaE